MTKFGSWLLVALIYATPLVGQEKAESFGIFETQDQYFEFMGSVKQVAANDPELRPMISMINDAVLQRPIGWTSKRYRDSGGIVDMLADDKVREELGMIDSQYDKLQETHAEIQKRVAEQLRELDLSNKDTMLEQLRKIRNSADEDLNAVLLPHQIERLQQINLQARLRFRSLAQLLSSEPLKSELEISDEQGKSLREAEREIEEELEREIAKLRAKAREKLIDRLKAGQKDKVRKLIGDLFEFPTTKSTIRKK